jgi:outer membrane protein assembly factor BamB
MTGGRSEKGVPRCRPSHACLWFFALFYISLPASGVKGEDWPQFRGPGGSGVSRGPAPPTEWGKHKNIRWKAPLPGKGRSNPVIAGGKVFVTASSGFQQQRLHVVCLDQATGKRLWQRRFQATGSTLCHPNTNMAAPTPVTDGKAVYSLFATGDLAALDAAGNLLWYRSLASDYVSLGNVNGLSASPVLWKDVLILPMDNIGHSFLAGVDVRSGRNRWKIARPRIHNWSSPFLVPQGDKAQLVIGGVPGLSAYDAQTGKAVWTIPGSSFSNIATPVWANGLILAGAGQLTALRPGTGKARPKVVWQTSKLRPSIGSPVCYEKRVYTINTPNLLVCADAADGKVLWHQRLAAGTYWSSPVAAAGKIYAVNEAGTTTVVQTGARPKVLAQNALGEAVLATPAIADGCIFLRSERHLYCVAGDRERGKE